MRRQDFFYIFAFALWFPVAGQAALVVNPPRPIAYRVNIQLIDTALDNGSSPATMMGDASQRADIEAKIDTIWAQAGIDINFLPNVVRYNNTFAYQGSGGTRSAGDLSIILDSAANAGGILNPDPSVIDMFFVNVAPGWPPEGSNWVDGLSNIGTNGIAEYVGGSVLSTDHGRELAAHWIAHEIGHNLGLYHPAAGSQNLMNGDTRTTDQLTSDQVDAVFGRQFRNDGVAFIPQTGTGFPKLIPEPAPGDYNRDGAVTAADYTVWRDTLSSNTFLAADGNGNGSIDAGDYAMWKANLGKSIPPPDLVGDFNHNGVVDAADFTVWRDTLGQTVAFGTGADANRNSLVDDGDFAMWKANFGKSIQPPGLAGDYNHNGSVDAADYTVWRNSLGSTTNLAADGNGNGTIDSGDYGVWKSNFGHTLASAGLTGDYNHDGIVDAADYTVWRDTLGSTTNLAADGNHNDQIDAGDYDVWRANFGNHSGSGASANAAVPEPATLKLLLVGMLALLPCRSRP